LNTDMDTKRVARPLRGRWLIGVVATAVALELALASLGFFRIASSGLQTAPVDLQSVRTHGGVSLVDGALRVTGDGTATLELDDAELRSLALTTTRTPAVFTLRIATKDQGHSRAFRQYLSAVLVHQRVRRSKTLSFEPMGRVKAVRLSFSDVRGAPTITGITQNARPPVSPDAFRFVTILTVLGFAGAVRRLRLASRVYDASNPRHRRALWFVAAGTGIIVAAFALGSSSISGGRAPDNMPGTPFSPSLGVISSDARFMSPDGVAADQQSETVSPRVDAAVETRQPPPPNVLLGLLTNPDTAEVRRSLQHYGIADAWVHGHLYLDIPADPLLASLDNPYDPSQRAAAGLSGASVERIGTPGTFPIDHAYKDGHIYSYFGVAPTLLFYYPVRQLTGRWLDGRIPITIMALMFVWAATALYAECLRRWMPRANLLVALLGAPAVLLASNVLLLITWPTHFQTAEMFGLTFAVAMVYFSLRAVQTPQCAAIWFAASGLCLAGAAASRPSMVVYAVALLPAAWELRRMVSPRRLIAIAAAFLLPVGIGAALLMWHNAARFGSVVEFGANYQLTSTDIRFNHTFALANLRPALYHYFFQPLQVLSRFPFVTASPTALSYAADRYYYAYPVAFGLLNIPVVAAAMLAPFVRDLIPPPGRRFLLAVGLVSAIALPWLIFGEAGVDTRYTTDFAFFLALIGMIGILGAVEALGSDRRGARLATGLACVALCVTIAVCMLVAVSGELNTVYANDPALYVTLTRAFDVLYF